MKRRFRVRAVPSTWLENNGRRLDCGPYVSGAIEAIELIRKHSTSPLGKLASRIFNAPRFPRVYVEDTEYGVPFLGSTDILNADLSYLPMLSRKQVQSKPTLVVDAGWILITRSGTIGRMAYSRSDMKGMAGSEHFMRVVPDKTMISSGYLHAYLSCRFGVPLVVSGTYGAIIQHIEPHHIEDLPIPRLGDVEQQAHLLIERAADNRVNASNLIEDAIQDVVNQLSLGRAKPRVPVRPSVSWQSSSLMLKRMDSFYYSDENLAARAAFDQQFSFWPHRAVDGGSAV